MKDFLYAMVFIFLSIFACRILTPKAINKKTKEEVNYWISESHYNVKDSIIDKAISKDSREKIINEVKENHKEENYSTQEQIVENNICAIDANFSKNSFYSWIKKVYYILIDIQKVEDISNARHLIDNELYQKLISCKNNFFDEDCNIVSGIKLISFEQDNNFDIVKVKLKSKNSLEESFSYKKYKEKSYILTFKRKKGLQTIHSTISNCPNCGAIIKVDNAGICEYCHTSITNGEYDWIVLDINEEVN